MFAQKIFIYSTSKNESFKYPYLQDGGPKLTFLTNARSIPHIHWAPGMKILNATPTRNMGECEFWSISQVKDDYGSLD